MRGDIESRIPLSPTAASMAPFPEQQDSLETCTLDSGYSSHEMPGVYIRKRYKYHDRGSGLYEHARKVGAVPHLVMTGRHAGRSNVSYIGAYYRKWNLHLWTKDFFTSIAGVSFPWLCLWMLLSYTLSYLFWAIVWYIVWRSAPDCVNGFERNFLSAYTFSVETQATIGFGLRSVGVCWSSSIFLTLQNVTGMILDAVCLGIVFAKISHPKHRGRSIFISDCATIAPRDGQLKFMFRIADIRSNTACDVKVKAYLFSWGEGRVSMEGEAIPVRVEPLELSSVDGQLLLPAVVEHRIDERSPLHGATHDTLEAASAEIVVMFEGVSEFGDSFLVRQSYMANEVCWGHVFVPIVHQAPPGGTQHAVDLSRFHDTMPLPGFGSSSRSEASRQVLAAAGRKLLPYPDLGEHTLVISDVCTVTTRGGEPHLAFRVGDTRPGQMLEAHVRAYLYNWQPTTTADGELLPYTVEEVNLGYDTGADRLILRYPQTVTHKITPDSPLAAVLNPPTSAAASAAEPPAAVELLVVVEAVMGINSANMVRNMTYRLPRDLRRGHCFVPMVARASADEPPSIDWALFHSVAPAGSKALRLPFQTRAQSVAWHRRLSRRASSHGPDSLAPPTGAGGGAVDGGAVVEMASLPAHNHARS